MKIQKTILKYQDRPFPKIQNDAKSKAEAEYIRFRQIASRD